MTIQTIIKKAVKRLELEGKLLTPDFYAEAFCKEAQKAGMTTEDCSHVATLSKTLNPDLQRELTQYRIKTMHELSRFLISKINRTSSTKCSEMLDAQTILIKRVLQVVEVLHNKEAAELARKTADLLNSSPAASQVEQFRQLWINFITTYDDTFLQTLQSYGDIDTGNLRKSIESLRLDPQSTTKSSSVNLEKVSTLLVASLVPSIASSVNEKIADVSEKIRKEPSLLDSQDTTKEVKEAIALRIALDKQSVKEMVESIDGVLDKLSLRLIDMIEKSDSSTDEIQKIKNELEKYNENEASNFKVAHKKLYTIAVALEKNTKSLSYDLRNHDGEMKLLSAKVKKLEKELEETKKASKEDFLTKVANRRGIDEVLAVKEAEFKRHEHNFSVIIFDLDKFKSINDNYGHDAGDAVLQAFSSILKKEARTEDVIGRLGGEEFIAVLGDTDTEGAVIFAEKVRKHVEKAKFMYKNQRIKVTVSSGVAERKKHISLDAVTNSADEYLYQAKHTGRNKVAYKK